MAVGGALVRSLSGSGPGDTFVPSVLRRPAIQYWPHPPRRLASHRPKALWTIRDLWSREAKLRFLLQNVFQRKLIDTAFVPRSTMCTTKRWVVGPRATTNSPLVGARARFKRCRRSGPVQTLYLRPQATQARGVGLLDSSLSALELARSICGIRQAFIGTGRKGSGHHIGAPRRGFEQLLPIKKVMFNPSVMYFSEEEVKKRDKV
jgi:hypothetical protein